MHLDQRERQKEERARERGIEQQRQQIDRRKGARPEQLERQHRCEAAPFGPQESGEQQHAAGERCGNSSIGQAEIRRGHQSEAHAAETKQRQDGALPIERPRRLRIDAFGDLAEHDPDRRQRQDRVDQKNPAPAEMIDHPPAQQRPDRGGDGQKAGPGSDRLAAFSSSNDAPISASEHGISSAAPKPCTARARISWATFGDNPHHSDAAAKIPTPAIKILRRPKRSAAAPPISKNADRQSV